MLLIICGAVRSFLAHSPNAIEDMSPAAPPKKVEKSENCGVVTPSDVTQRHLTNFCQLLNMRKNKYENKRNSRLTSLQEVTHFNQYSRAINKMIKAIKVEKEADEYSPQLDENPHWEGIWYAPKSEIDDDDQQIEAASMPKKCGDLYKKSFNDFTKWRNLKENRDISENLMLEYFGELSKTYAPSTMWTKYSMLKNTILSHHKIDIENYKEIIVFLKRYSTGYQPKKAFTLSGSEISTFLETAPDHDYLATKVNCKTT